jgi:fumarate reductase subunit D
MTMGMANPVLSLEEDVLAVAGAWLALVAPFVAALLAVLLTVGLVLAARCGLRALARSASRR